ncbi:MAG: DNA polymerase III subunit alpha [Erysipelotrichaceae bacterium]|nr:DNA polymerase III subunit alpha [Erysipelotrichaceae bacterium]
MTVLLHNRSCYSILGSTITVEKLVSFARESGYQAIGLADAGNLFAGCQFIRRCAAEGIKPVLGMEVSVLIEERRYPFIIYPRNSEGYLELLHLTSQMKSEDGCITSEQLKSLSSDCLIVIGYLNGWLTHLIITGQKERLEKTVCALPENYYLALPPRNNNMEFLSYRETIIPLSGKHNVRLLPMKLALYADAKEYEGYQAMQAIKYQTTISDDQLVFNADAALLSPKKAEEQYSADELRETDRFASLIDLKIDSIHSGLPVISGENNTDSKIYLRQLCIAGLQKRLNGKDDPVYRRRLDYELQIITSMNFENYFLIVYDIILQARKQDINIGPGRGSAVGSLVAWCLGITHIDPIRYGLYFERFLNPERAKMPDIDIDIPDASRQDIIYYCRQRYGADRVAHIITFSSLAARAVLRDVSAALGMQEGNVEMIMRSLGNSTGRSLMENYRSNASFSRLIKSSDENIRLFRIALMLEGLPRNISTHASGIVISDRAIADTVPVISVSDNLTTQYAMEYLESFGLIKFDFLGLRNLSTITEISKSIDPGRRNLDILKIPLNDKATYDLLCRVDTNGIFQLEAEAMKNVTAKLQPRSLEELAIVMALGRPGSSAYIDQYVINRDNPSSITYLHEDFREILSSTCGIVIYQEQVMQIAQKIGGFSLGKANLLREAISKKKAENIEALKNDFYSGALSRGYSSKVVDESYQLILKFAGYGFNKSHAMAYALIAYQLAYFKANHPLHFYCAILNSVLGNNEKTNVYIRECRGRNIEIRVPDVNFSSTSFIIKDDAIIFPLNAIKGISSSLAEKIIAEREQKGAYADFMDFYQRFCALEKDSKYLESLIRGCALDGFNESHTTMLNGITSLQKYVQAATSAASGQISLDFDLIDDKPELDRYADNRDQLLNDQFSFLGVYLDTLPTEDFRKNYPHSLLANDIAGFRGDLEAVVIVNSVKQHRTRTGEQMAFVSCMDESGYVDLAVMPREYQRYSPMLKKGIIIYVRGRKDERNSVRVNELKLIRG